MPNTADGCPGAGSPKASLWGLKSDVSFLNHGSFGACPTQVLERQRELREEMEAEPVRFFVHRLEGRLDESRAELASLVGSEPGDLAFVQNATTAVNAVLRSRRFVRGDELLTTDHEYNACRNVLDFVADRAGARVRVARVPFPLRSPDEVLEAVLAQVNGKTRLALLDHITSQTGLVFPIRRLVAELSRRGVDTLVDGAHAVGQLDLDVPGIGAAYFTANCHKWLCAPKGAAFLWVRPDLQPDVRPPCISHGANSPRIDRSRFLLEFDWMGTVDPTPFLSIPAAIRFMESLLPGGLKEVRHHNRHLVIYGRDRLCETLGVEAPAPDSMVGSLASVPLPDGSTKPQTTSLYADALQDDLYVRGFEVPVIPWPAPPKRLLRISAQVYNTRDQYDRLAAALREIL